MVSQGGEIIFQVLKNEMRACAIVCYMCNVMVTVYSMKIVGM